MNQKLLEKIYNATLVFGFFNLVLLFIVYKNPDLSINLSKLIPYISLMKKAYINTFTISISSLALSIFLGIVLFFMSISEKLYFRYFYQTFSQIMLGIPLMVHVIVLYFFLTSSMGIKNAMIAGILILSAYMSTYFAKTFEGSFNSIDQQQFKSMYILRIPKSVQFTHIIFPQIIKQTMPTLTSHFSLLIKSTALLSLISVPEFTDFINTFNSKTLEFVTGYLILGVGYLFITIPLSVITTWLNKRVNQI